MGDFVIHCYGLSRGCVCRVVRTIYNISLSSVADYVGVNSSTVSRFERDEFYSKPLVDFYNKLVLSDPGVLRDFNIGFNLVSIGLEKMRGDDEYGEEG